MQGTGTTIPVGQELGPRQGYLDPGSRNPNNLQLPNIDYHSKAGPRFGKQTRLNMAWATVLRNEDRMMMM